MNAFQAALRMQERRNAMLAARQGQIALALATGKPVPRFAKLRRLTTESATRRVLGLKGHR